MTNCAVPYTAGPVDLTEIEREALCTMVENKIRRYFDCLQEGYSQTLADILVSFEGGIFYCSIFNRENRDTLLKIPWWEPDNRVEEMIYQAYLKTKG